MTDVVIAPAVSTTAPLAAIIGTATDQKFPDSCVDEFGGGRVVEVDVAGIESENSVVVSLNETYV